MGLGAAYWQDMHKTAYAQLKEEWAYIRELRAEKRELRAEKYEAVRERDALLAALEALTKAARKQLPQGADHDGLNNCQILAKANEAIAKAKGGE